MAIYSLHHSSVGRSTHAEGTAGAHVGYITRTSACRIVVGSDMPIPAPGSKGGEARKWLDAQENKDRKNARVIDKLMLALPLELNANQRVEVVRSFVKTLSGGQDLPWLAAIHDRDQDADNPHAHVVLRDRSLETGKRVIGMSEKGSTERARSVWEDVCNQALEMAGSSARIDRRSLKEQGIDRAPSGHEGPQPRQIEQKGRHSDVLARIRARRLLDNEYRRSVDQRAEELLQERTNLVERRREIEEQRGWYMQKASFTSALRETRGKIGPLREEVSKQEKQHGLITRKLTKLEVELKYKEDYVASWYAENQPKSAFARIVVRMGRERRPESIQLQENRLIPELRGEINSLRTALKVAATAITRAKARISEIFAKIGSHPEVQAFVDLELRAVRRAEQMVPTFAPQKQAKPSPALPEPFLGTVLPPSEQIHSREPLQVAPDLSESNPEQDNDEDYWDSPSL